MNDFGKFWRTLFESRYEHIAAIFHSTANKSDRVGWKLLGSGCQDRVSLNVDSLLEEASAVNAKAITLIHNHPMGLGRPSETDILSTSLLREALEEEGLVLLDHFIVGGQDKKVYSFSTEFFAWNNN